MPLRKPTACIGASPYIIDSSVLYCVTAFQVSSRVFVQHQVSVGGRVVDKQGIQLGAFVYVVGESILYLLSPNNPNFDTKLGLLLFVRKARNDSHSGILTVGTKRQIYCMESVFFPNLTAIALRESGFP